MAEVNVLITAYNAAQSPTLAEICNFLAAELMRGLPNAESKVWHGGPVWFLDGNPIAGYWVRKTGVQLLFWSGQSFNEPTLKPEGKFKAAEAHYKNIADVNATDMQRWLGKAAVMQWDYKNIVKRKGKLEKWGEW
jgi:hypothetical protein